MRQSEADRQTDILADLGSDPDYLVYRHSTGVARSFDDPSRIIKFGLRGSGDVAGCMRVIIRPEHVGQLWGRALMIEVKEPGNYQSQDQKAFESAWKFRNGIYIVAHSAQEAREKLAEYR